MATPRRKTLNKHCFPSGTSVWQTAVEERRERKRRNKTWTNLACPPIPHSPNTHPSWVHLLIWSCQRPGNKRRSPSETNDPTREGPQLSASANNFQSYTTQPHLWSHTLFCSPLPLPLFCSPVFQCYNRFDSVMVALIGLLLENITASIMHHLDHYQGLYS